MNQAQTGWVTIALLGRTRGNRGELTAIPLSSKPERFADLQAVFLFGTGERFTVQETWFHGDTLIFKFEGIDSISDAERLSGAEVRVPMPERVALDEGEYFLDDLVGCEVVEHRTGVPIGRVTSFEEGGGGGGLLAIGDLLIPFAKSICVEIDPAAKRIAVELPEGLKDLNRQ